ncbi:MAG TPA: hypothetical protein VGX03_39705 [Candidatus Binatia bacterium]|jgi:hypothetical protein|nr:hypothetical protein [Candidatus Binatia bacterium]
MAKKDAIRDPRLPEGKKTLEQWGMTLARLQEQSLTMADIEARIGQDPAADVALAALLGDYPTPETAHVLVAWENKTDDKNLRREIHRSLYKLSQKGVRVERPTQEPARPVLTPVEPEGYLSSMDGHGDRLVWLIKPKVGGGLHYLSALVNEPEGMRYVEGAEVTRKGFRIMRQDLSDRHQIAMLEVPWRYCDALMYEGYERARARDGKEIESYPALRSHLISTPAQPVEVPLPASLDPEAIAADENLLATSVQLFEEPQFQRWLLDHDQAHVYIDQIAQAQESPLVLNRYQQQDRVQTVIEKAISEVFSVENGRSYARRLEEATLHLVAGGRLEVAKRALAVALALKRSERGGKGIPFCEELVRQSIAMHYHEERQQEQEQAQGSLIMKPAEFAARMQAAQRRRMG